ncbi:MAG TPA: hypothetical protein VF186_09015 [Gaiellaceae bacterium]|jgi:hypothetical protein
MTAVVATAAGLYGVDLDEETVEPWTEPAPGQAPAPPLNLPRVVAAAAAGSTVVAVVDAKPPLLVSHDAGSTWRESGRGLPAGQAVAVSADDPDTIVYAARNRLYVSRNGGVFWAALAVELPEIVGVALSGS